MRPRNYFLLLPSFLLLLLLSGFKPGEKDKEPEGFVFIPMGTSGVGGQQFHTSAFWMAETEVTNEAYNTFLQALKDAGRDAEYEKAAIRTGNWRDGMSYMDPMAEYYHSHPAYASYPVVNVTREGAEMYCAWLNASLEEGETEYRLPNRLEWMYAAAGGYDLVSYAWPGSALVDKKGNAMCNYRKVGDRYIHTNEDGTVVIEPGDWEQSNVLTAPVKSYAPNEYGLYNMCGNVAEMVAEEGIAMGGSWNSTGYDVRITSEMKFEDASIYVGFRLVKDFKGKDRE